MELKELPFKNFYDIDSKKTTITDFWTNRFNKIFKMLADDATMKGNLCEKHCEEQKKKHSPYYRDRRQKLKIHGNSSRMKTGFFSLGLCTCAAVYLTLTTPCQFLTITPSHDISISWIFWC